MNQQEIDKFKPVECQNLDDIKRAIKPFLNEADNKEVKLMCNIDWREGAQSGIDQVTGSSVDVSLRQLLIDGMDVVKKRSTAFEKMREAKKAAEEAGIKFGFIEEIWDVDNCKFSVDALIERKLGGKRVGTRISWKVSDGNFEFDPYINKLFKVD